MLTQGYLNLCMFGRPEAWMFASCRKAVGVTGGVEEDQEGSLCERNNSKPSSPMEKFHFVLLLLSIRPIKVTLECICLFASFLGHSYKAAASIQNYISGVHTMYAQLEVPFPGADNIELNLTLRGLKTTVGCWLQLWLTLWLQEWLLTGYRLYIHGGPIIMDWLVFFPKPNPRWTHCN